MKPKFHIFLDRRQLLLLFLSVLFCVGTVSALVSADLPRDIGWCIAATLLSFAVLAGALIHPCLYVMTPRGLWTCYAFGFVRSFIPWNTVRKVEKCTVRGIKRIPYFNDVFRIHGKAEGPHFWFMDNEMVRTRRARRLLERYTGIPVAGYALKSFSQMKQDRRDRKALAERRAQRQARVDRRREDEKMTKRHRG